MSNIINIFRLIRIKNLITICIMNVLIKLFIINQSIEFPALTQFHFYIYLITLISIIAGGYIINDIYDIKIDKINKPQDIVITNKISVLSAWKIYYFLNITAITSGVYLVLEINKFWLLSFFLFFIIFLWLYSKKYKTTFLLGNLQVAFLTSLSIVSLVLFDLLPLYSWDSIVSSKVFSLIIFYATFCFLTTLLREIIKDIEDIGGDSYYNANTLAIKYGIKKTKRIVYSIIIIIMFLVAFIQYLLLIKIFNNDINVQISYNKLFFLLSILFFTVIVQALFNILLKRLVFAKQKSNYTYLTKVCKFIMLIGILSIPFVSLYY